MYLIDTNMLSELRKGKKANRGVQNFFTTADPHSLYLSVQTIGEIRRGIEMLIYRGDIKQSRLLAHWLNTVTTEYDDHILDFDEDCAQVWGRLMVPINQHPIDKQIAAIALIHGLDVVTRNVNGFSGTGVHLINPFI